MTRTASIALVVCLWASTANAEGVGWLLMRPHVEAGEIQTDEHISQWHQVAAFDTAQDCMQEKLSLEGLFFDRVEDAESAAWTMALAALEASRCVPAEYVCGREVGQPSSGSSDAQPISGWSPRW
jgi:hypothetical protein